MVGSHGYPCPKVAPRFSTKQQPGRGKYSSLSEEWPPNALYYPATDRLLASFGGRIQADQFSPGLVDDAEEGK